MSDDGSVQGIDSGSPESVVAAIASLTHDVVKMSAEIKRLSADVVSLENELRHGGGPEIVFKKEAEWCVTEVWRAPSSRDDDRDVSFRSVRQKSGDEFVDELQTLDKDGRIVMRIRSAHPAQMTTRSYTVVSPEHEVLHAGAMPLGTVKITPHLEYWSDPNADRDAIDRCCRTIRGKPGDGFVTELQCLDPQGRIVMRSRWLR